jgi:dienelactone hydrolase
MKLGNFLVTSILFTLLILTELTVIAKAASVSEEMNLTIEDFLAKADVADAEISPNGRYLALIFNKEKSYHVVIRDIEQPGRPVTGMLSEKVIRPTSIYWANNERLLVNLLVPERTQRVIEKSQEEDDFDIDDYRMYRRTISIDVEAKNSILLMGDRRRLSNNRNLSRIRNFIPDDPKHILMPVFGNGRLELFKVNIYTGVSKKIERGTRFTYAFLSNDKGEPQYRYDYLRVAKVIDIYEKKEDEWEKIDRIDLSGERKENIDAEGLIGLIGDDKLVYRKQNVDSGYYELLIRERGSNEISVLASSPGQDIEGIVLSRGTDQILGYTTEKDFIRYHLFDKELQQAYNTLADQVGEYNFFVYSSRQQEKNAIVKSYGPDNPGRFYIYNYKTQKLQFLADQYSKLSPKTLSIPALVNYKARDGQSIRAYILLPTDYNKKLPMPMVVLPHGGPHARDSATYDNFSQMIASLGFIVIKPNFRGSTGYGRSFEEAGFGEWGGLMQDDVTDAVNFMIGAGYADPKKICIAGLSYGGYSALMGAIKTPELYQCAISIAGVTHLEEQIDFSLDRYSGNKKKLRNILYKRIGNPNIDSKKLAHNSPVNRADKINIPILLIAGDKDRRVPFEQAEMMHDALKDNGKQVEFLQLEDTGHNVFYYQEDIESIYTNVARFLTEHL